MHLLQTSSATLDDIVEPVDLGQTPGDIVVLSFADSDLAGLAAAYAAESDALPSLRLAHLARPAPSDVDRSVDRYGGAARQSHRGAAARRARLVALWGRGACRRWRATAASRWRCCRARTATTRGCSRRRPCRPTTCRPCCAIFREGGPQNLRGLLRRLARHAGATLDAPQPQRVPRMAGYVPGKGAVPLHGLRSEIATGPPWCRSSSTARRCSPPTPRPSTRCARRLPRAGWRRRRCSCRA